MKHTYTISGMHCESCVAKVTEALEGIGAVTDAEVTLKPPRAQVTMREHVDLSQLNQAVQDKGGYELAEAEGAENGADTQADAPPESLYPLLLIVGYILGAVVLIAWATGRWETGPMMRHFMAGFFLTFSFFKLLDPPGFVSAYRGYDLLAKRSQTYAYAYPYIELLLGVAYLLDAYPVPLNTVTLVLMLIGAAGVLRALLDKRAIRCACLGTALNLPMTKVTLIEDLTMAAMAAAMLVMHAL